MFFGSVHIISRLDSQSNSIFFPVLSRLILYLLVIFSSKNIKRGHQLEREHIYMFAGSCIRPRPHISRYFRKRRFFFSTYLKNSASTQIVFKSCLHAPTYTQKRFSYARLHILSMHRLRAHAPCDKNQPAKITGP